MSERHTRTAMLIGEAALEKIKNSRVALFGLGGVGGYTAEALVRAGVGAIDIFDSDTVSESNINRQVIATYETLGEYKTDAFEKRILSINPECRVTKHTVFVTKESAEEMVNGGIGALWNFTPYKIKVDENIVVQETSLYAHLAVMFNRLNEK